MFNSLIKGKKFLQITINNKMRHICNDKFLNNINNLKINYDECKYVKKYVFITKITTIVGATLGGIVYGSEELLKNVENPFIIHFIETMKGTSDGIFYGTLIGFFWPITATVLLIRFSNLLLKTQYYNIHNPS
jgi:hypothetical protein